MRKMQRWILAGLVMVLLTLAFASSVYAGHFDPGSCPYGSEKMETTGSWDRNGDGFVCVREIGRGNHVVVDNNVGGPPG